jgi:transposase
LRNTTHWGKIEATRSLVLCSFSYSKHANERWFFQPSLTLSPVSGELPRCKFRNYSGEFFANLLAVSYTKGRWCYWLLLCEKDILWRKLPYHSSPFQMRKERKRWNVLRSFALLWKRASPRRRLARTQKLAASTIQSWVKRYREKSLAGLANNVARSDKGKSRRLPTEAIQLIEGLALQTPPRSIASIHRQIVGIAKEQGWPAPGYNRVYTIVKKLDPALVTMAHQGAAAYRPLSKGGRFFV